MAKVSVKDHGKTQENRMARLKRHMKSHPKDEQSLDCVKHNPRKKPFAKGSAPAASKPYRDDAGHKLVAPLFEAVVKATK